MSTFTSETEADAAVIRQLIKELNRRQVMSKIVVATDGTIYEMHQFEVLSREEAQARLDRLNAEVSVLQAAVSDNQTTPADPNAPADPAQAPQDNPVVALAPAETPTNLTPEQPAQPSEQPVPATKAPVAPAVTTPAPDVVLQ